MLDFDFGAGRFDRHSWIVAFAAILFAGIVFLRFVIVSPTESVLLLCVVPIALIAMEYGTAGGLVAATVSVGLVVSYSVITGVGLGFVGYLSRVGSFYFVGALIGWFTEQRRALEEKHTRWFQTSRDLSCTAGFDGYFKSLNPAWEKTFGFSIRELKSRPFIDFVHPEDRQATSDRRLLLAKTGEEPTTFTNRYRAKDGSYRWL